jgi:hypothetical protein
MDALPQAIAALSNVDLPDAWALELAQSKGKSTAFFRMLS